MLTSVAPDLWAFELHRRKLGLHVRNRMVVVRLPSGGLWVHSPVEMTDALVAELEALGPVEYGVAPNLGHHLWAGVIKERFPGAQLWGCPRMAEKRADLSWDGVLADEGMPWADALETIRLEGSPDMEEVVFFHRPSRTLICTDWLINVFEEDSPLTRVLYWMIGVWRRQGPASLFKWRTKDRAAAVASYERVLALDFDRIVMAHGEIIEADARATMIRAQGWLLGEDPQLEGPR